MIGVPARKRTEIMRVLLYTLSEAVLMLNRGDLLVFKGNVVHCGAEYDCLNVRLHYFSEPAYRPKGKLRAITKSIELTQTKSP
jgi:hypothetical protein